MNNELVQAINKWREVPVGCSGRENLDETDMFWQLVFAREPKLRFPSGKLVFRIHRGGYEEPRLEDFSDWRERGASSQYDLFNNFHKEWENTKDPSKIRFDNHWVSFTKNPKHFLDSYYEVKGLRGLAIVLSTSKAVDISSIHVWGNVQDEQEVVAPLDKAQVVEILPFAKFKEQYCKSKSEE